MRLQQATTLAAGVQRYLAQHGVTTTQKLVRDAVAAGLGSEDWAAYRKQALTPSLAEARDYKPTPSLEMLHYLGRELGERWGNDLVSPNSYGKLFVIVADEAGDAQQAAVASQIVLQLKGRVVQRLDFSAFTNRDEVEDEFSAIGLRGGDVAQLSGMQDGEDYDVLWAFLRAKWQVVVQVTGADELFRLFARTSLCADDKQIGGLLGLKRETGSNKLLAYRY